MLSTAQQADFQRDGYVVVPGFVPPELLDAARARFEALFRGEFETGLQPDEWNWRHGGSAADHTRQICNGWKADRAIAALVLRREVGEACARLMDWSGARLNQDNVIWKPPGAKPLGFHQDDAYEAWVVPQTMVTCWMALDDTTPEGGTIEYAPGSHRWPLTGLSHQFHAPDDHLADAREAARDAGVGELRIERLQVSAGDAVFHHGGTWHGSGSNRSEQPRRSVVAHCMPADAQFHPCNIGPIYSRYKRFDSLDMDESFFPILWCEDGHRSGFIERYLQP